MRIPLWGLALATTLGMQSVASFLSQSLPTVAPLLTAEAGLAPERIGNLSSMVSVGTIVFLVFGGPLLVRLGPVRALQAGAVVAVTGLALAATGWWPLLVLGALMMGIGYGPSPPAGSRILAATAPMQHRTLIFSIKQAGAPAGGAVAGMLLAPIAALYGGPVALLVSMAIGLLAAIAIGPARAALDLEKRATQLLHWRSIFHPAKIIAPFRLLGSHPALLSITVMACSFAAVQGSLFSFSITYLVIGRGMTLPEAGLAYACMQCAGVGARIFLGWLADRTGRPAHNLTVQAFAAAVLVVIYANLPLHPPLGWTALVCGATGFLSASWNGIYMAEVARLSPVDQITEVTSSSTVVTFLGYVAGPTLLSVLVTISGGWRLPFLTIAAQLALMAAVQSFFLVRSSRRGSRTKTEIA
jgi:MFS family permease